MKRVLLFLAVAFTSLYMSAQNRVMLQSNGSSSVYSTIGAAYTAAVAGDTIYISGGKYYEGLSINKPNLVILGVGYRADSSKATGITEVQGNITLNANADNGKIQGIYITGNLAVYDIDHYEISRNRIEGIIDMKFGVFPNTLLIEENVLNGGIPSSIILNNVVLQKNIIYAKLQNFNENCVINNNVILRASTIYCFMYFTNVLIENNIINYTYSNDLIYSSVNNTNYLSNNIFITNLDFQTTGFGNATFTDNKYVAPADINKVFVNYDETLVYNQANDFHLNPDSAGVWIGTDATPIGIFGTKDAASVATPFKENTLPFNPHIAEKTVAKFTDENGKLQVNFKVNSQLK